MDSSKYAEPSDPTTGHHLERDNECGLKLSEECDGKLRDNQGHYSQVVTKQGKICSCCVKCRTALREAVQAAKEAKKNK